MHQPHPSRPRVFVTIRQVPPEAWPAVVVRHQRSTVVVYDPRATKLELLTWTVANLTTAEQDVIRAGYGQPPVGQPVEDWAVEGGCMPYVPPALRMPGEPGWQATDTDETSLGEAAWVIELAEGRLNA